MGKEAVSIGQSNADTVTQRRALAVDTGLGMLVLVVVGTAITANVGDEAASPGIAAYSFGAVFGALMLVRRRWPVATLLVTVAALIAYYMLSFPPIGLAVPVAAALYSAAEQGRPRWAIGTAVGLLLVSSLVRVLVEGDDPALVLGYEFAASAGLMGAVIAVGDGVRARRGWRAELDRRARAARVEREQEAERRVEQERLRIARDLHDLLAHTVSVISLHTDVARESMHDDPDAALRSLGSVRAACSDVVRELRATVGVLRSGGDTAGDHAPSPGLDDLDALTRAATATGLDVQVRTSGTRLRLPSVADSAAYHVIQESLSNVLRHAGARHAIVELDYRSDALLLRISDDGRGADPDRMSGASAGWGIIGMRERMALLGGTLQTTSRRGEGFVVQARIPVTGPS